MRTVLTYRGREVVPISLTMANSLRVLRGATPLAKVSTQHQPGRGNHQGYIHVMDAAGIIRMIRRDLVMVEVRP